MRHNLPQPWKKHRAGFALPLLSLMGATLFYVTSQAPMQQELAQLTQRNETLTSALQSRRTALARNDELRTSLMELEHALAEARSAIPQDPVAAALMDFLTRTHAETGARLTTLSHLETKLHENVHLTQSHYALTALGDYLSVIALLERIEQKAPAIAIGRVTLRRAPTSAAPELEVQAELRTLSSPGATGTPLDATLRVHEGVRNPSSRLDFPTPVQAPILLLANATATVDPFRPLEPLAEPPTSSSARTSAVLPASLPLHLPLASATAPALTPPAAAAPQRAWNLAPLPEPLAHLVVEAIFLGAERLVLLRDGDAPHTLLLSEGDWLPASHTRIQAITPDSVVLSRRGETITVTLSTLQ